MTITKSITAPITSVIQHLTNQPKPTHVKLPIFLAKVSTQDGYVTLWGRIESTYTDEFDVPRHTMWFPELQRYLLVPDALIVASSWITVPVGGAL